MDRKLIAYYRVSTKQQGASGLGLDAQRSAVSDFARQSGGKIEAAYTEVESGKRADRPELAKAIAHARRSKATLVIAKLDRLAHNVAFVSALMESGADFVAVDNATANRLTIHILAAVAEDEARRISGAQPWRWQPQRPVASYLDRPARTTGLDAKRHVWKAQKRAMKHRPVFG